MENKQPQVTSKAGQPRVINKAGTTKLADAVVAEKEQKAEREFRNNRRDNRRNRRAMEEQAPKEFDSITINIGRVARVVKGGRRFRFQALVAIGNHKNKVGVGLAKGSDVTSAVAKAEQRAKKNMITFAMNGETICHEVETKVTGAQVLMKPAAPGTGIIAGGVVRSVIGLTGVKNLISKSIGSTNKINIAYAVVEGLKQQVPKKDWHRTESADATSKERTQSMAIDASKKGRRPVTTGATPSVSKEVASKPTKETK